MVADIFLSVLLSGETDGTGCHTILLRLTKKGNFYARGAALPKPETMGEVGWHACTLWAS